MTLLLGFVGLWLLFIGGEVLVRGASSLALRLGLSPLSVGLTVVAFGTSAPELVVSLDAAAAGVPDIALGNVIGSNIANLTLILGVAALVRPVRVLAVTVRREAPLVVALSILLVVMLLDGTVGRLEGAALVFGLGIFTTLTLRTGRRESARVEAEADGTIVPEPGSVLTSVFMVAAGLGGLVFGGQLFLEAAVELARAFDVSEAVIGLTVVAVGTSLPELATSLLAALRNQGDMAVGNVLGSNVFNILGILGVTAVVLPLSATGITATTLAVMVATALAVPLLGFTGSRLSRLEGAVLLGGYVAYVGWLVSNAVRS